MSKELPFDSNLNSYETILRLDGDVADYILYQSDLGEVSVMKVKKD